MEILLKNNGVTDLFSTLSFLAADLKFINLLLNENAAKKFYEQLGWFESGNYFPNVAASILKDFIGSHQEIIKSYMMLEIPLYQVCRKLINHIVEHKIHFDKDKLYACLIHYANPVDQKIKSILRNRGYQKHINILGFGLRDGIYEQSISEILCKEGLAETIKIYGFDPYSKEASPTIEMLPPTTLGTGNNPQFDIILVRWVLHHIHHSERWTDFISCLNQCSPGGTIILVEEGCFSSKASKNAGTLLYELLLGCADVIINSALHHQWLVDIESGDSSSFFIDYLSLEDIYTIENAIHNTIQRAIYSMGPPFFKQTLITYKTLASIKVNNK